MKIDQKLARREKRARFTQRRQNRTSTKHQRSKHITPLIQRNTRSFFSSVNLFFVLLGPKPCKNCESRMSEANPRQSLVKGERLIRYELASAILGTRAANKTRTFKWGRRSGRNLGCRLQKKEVLWLLFANFSASIAMNTFYLHERPGHHKFFPMEWPPQQ